MQLFNLNDLNSKFLKNLYLEVLCRDNRINWVRSVFWFSKKRSNKRSIERNKRRSIMKSDRRSKRSKKINYFTTLMDGSKILSKF
jgi:hypothetical protein